MEATWSALQLALVLWVAVAVPLEIGFDTFRGVAALTAMSWVVSVCFGLDVLVRFRTTFTTPQGEVVRSPGRIATRYLRGLFVLDVAAALPVQAFLGGTGLSEYALWFQLLKLPRIFRLSELLALSRTKYDNLMAAGRLLGLMLLVTLVGDRPDTFNNVERVLAILLLIIGTCFFAITVSAMSLLVSNLWSMAARHEQREALAREALEYAGAAPEVHERVSAYFRRMADVEHPGAEGVALLSELPAGLHAEVQLFAFCERPFVWRLSQRLRIAAFMPRDVIYEYGSVGHEMYVIWKGAVALLGPGGAVAALQCAGDHFGELGLMTANTPRPHKAVALQPCDTVVLGRWDLLDVMRDFPDSAALVSERSQVQLEDHEAGPAIWAAALVAGGGGEDEGPDGPEPGQEGQEAAAEPRRRPRRQRKDSWEEQPASAAVAVVSVSSDPAGNVWRQQRGSVEVSASSSSSGGGVPASRLTRHTAEKQRLAPVVDSEGSGRHNYALAGKPVGLLSRSSSGAVSRSPSGGGLPAWPLRLGSSSTRVHPIDPRTSDSGAEGPEARSPFSAAAAAAAATPTLARAPSALDDVEDLRPSASSSTPGLPGPAQGLPLSPRWAQPSAPASDPAGSVSPRAGAGPVAEATEALSPALQPGEITPGPGLGGRRRSSGDPGALGFAARGVANPSRHGPPSPLPAGSTAAGARATGRMGSNRRRSIGGPGDVGDWLAGLLGGNGATRALESPHLLASSELSPQPPRQSVDDRAGTAAANARPNSTLSPPRPEPRLSLERSPLPGAHLASPHTSLGSPLLGAARATARDRRASSDYRSAGSFTAPDDRGAGAPASAGWRPALTRQEESDELMHEWHAEAAGEDIVGTWGPAPSSSRPQPLSPLVLPPQPAALRQRRQRRPSLVLAELMGGALASNTLSGSRPTTGEGYVGAAGAAEPPAPFTPTAGLTSPVAGPRNNAVPAATFARAAARADRRAPSTQAAGSRGVDGNARALSGGGRVARAMANVAAKTAGILQTQLSGGRSGGRDPAAEDDGLPMGDQRAASSMGDQVHLLSMPFQPLFGVDPLRPLVPSAAYTAAATSTYHSSSVRGYDRESDGQGRAGLEAGRGGAEPEDEDSAALEARVAKLELELETARAALEQSRAQVATWQADPIRVPAVASLVRREVAAVAARLGALVESALGAVSDKLGRLSEGAELLTAAVAAADERLHQLEVEARHSRGALGVLEGTEELEAATAAASASGAGPLLSRAASRRGSMSGAAGAAAAAATSGSGAIGRRGSLLMLSSLAGLAAGGRSRRGSVVMPAARRPSGLLGWGSGVLSGALLDSAEPPEGEAGAGRGGPTAARPPAADRARRPSGGEGLLGDAALGAALFAATLDRAASRKNSLRRMSTLSAAPPWLAPPEGDGVGGTESSVLQAAPTLSRAASLSRRTSFSRQGPLSRASSIRQKGTSLAGGAEEGTDNDGPGSGVISPVHSLPSLAQLTTALHSLDSRLGAASPRRHAAAPGGQGRRMSIRWAAGADGGSGPDPLDMTSFATEALQDVSVRGGRYGGASSAHSRSYGQLHEEGSGGTLAGESSQDLLSLLAAADASPLASPPVISVLKRDASMRSGSAPQLPSFGLLKRTKSQRMDEARESGAGAGA
ncbi:hypothetical protein HYH03_005343 [Edaphochlamys debaryana]|uniref:Cyclic nucleotide-binding domain-containing protein n=1 Tax=Edaphochlamys debaryana TaxID=47281 RepID=A0A835YF83_9CHLO|nr:hypothetical protein HYH03_005343 [Edaphochlamys debaryana]|eukprot:KAG2496519.1 hypothetical protein HYH03_005343 [Edaphochlamys debaryana]